MKKGKLLSALVIGACFFQSFGQDPLNDAYSIDNSGAWCWFSDPRAIFLHGESTGVLTGWVTMDGSVETALIDPEKGQIQRQIIYPQLEKDDHDNPAFLELLDGRYMAFYAKHVNKYLYYHGTGSPHNLFGPVQTFDPISKDELERYPRGGVTYANPVQLSAEDGRIYCFGRWTGYKPNMMWSDDNGHSFSKSRVFIAEEGFREGNRPYVKYYSDGCSRIHLIFTDGHPRNEPMNSVYYAYYEDGGFHRADGSLICDVENIPFAPREASLVYRAEDESGRAWVHDVVADRNGHPVILYTRHPTEKDHLYHYARFDGKTWSDHLICHSGKWFPQTQEGKREKEPHYSGGMVLHPRKPETVFLSREVNGIFEIEAWKTKNGGKSWNSTSLTSASERDNVRPYVPRNMRKGDPTVVLWMENESYIHYTDYTSRIMYRVL